MKEVKYGFSKLNLMWRPSRGYNRIKVGCFIVPKNNLKPLQFKYDLQGIEEAKGFDKNFIGLPGLPIDNDSFDENIIKAVIKTRLIDLERPDAKDFIDFWLIDKDRIKDPIYIVAQTQGINYNDMFEFIPQYTEKQKDPYITDVAGLSYSNFNLEKIKIGDKLKIKLERNNPKDSNAVALYFDKELVGYIKKGFNLSVSKNPANFIISVWDKNNFPSHKKLYIKIQPIS